MGDPVSPETSGSRVPCRVPMVACPCPHRGGLRAGGGDTGRGDTGRGDTGRGHRVCGGAWGQGWLLSPQCPHNVPPCLLPRSPLVGTGRVSPLAEVGPVSPCPPRSVPMCPPTASPCPHLHGCPLGVPISPPPTPKCPQKMSCPPSPQHPNVPPQCLGVTPTPVSPPVPPMSPMSPSPSGAGLPGDTAAGPGCRHPQGRWGHRDPPLSGVQVSVSPSPPCCHLPGDSATPRPCHALALAAPNE